MLIQPSFSTQYMAGGDLRAALDKDARRNLVWDRKGQQVALDIARGIHFLHSHDVSVPNQFQAAMALSFCLPAHMRCAAAV